jgi:hypothetical protein
MNLLAAESDGTDTRNEPTFATVLAQLEEALKLIDALDISPDIGALLQEVINRIREIPPN